MIDLPELLDLDDIRCGDPGVVGGKAAALALARRAGLPALRGVVVGVAASRRALERGATALSEGGSGAARLAVLDAPVDDGLVDALRDAVRALGTPVVARSSSPLEPDGLWAGAFSSLEDVGTDDLATAVRSVWASTFGVDVLQRAHDCGVDVAALGLAVLVQPQLRPVCGGSARVEGDTVQVHAVRGSPRALLGGWESGVRAVVDLRGHAAWDGPSGGLAMEPLARAAALARDAQRALGADLIEWAWTGSDVVLLQAGRAPPTVRSAPATASPALRDPLALRLARAVQRFPGALGDALVVPWAVAQPQPPEAPVVAASAAPLADLAAAEAAAAELTAQAWQLPPGEAAATAVRTLSAARGDRPAPALARIGQLREVDAGLGQRVVDQLAAVAGAVAARGDVPVAAHAWRQPPEALRRVLAAGAARRPERQRLGPTGHRLGPTRQRLGPDRWEPFVHSVVRAHGTDVVGTPAVGGVAAGRVVVVSDPHDPPPLAPRDVVVAQRPLHSLAPLLWTAAALVTATGTRAAHLVEVATSLGLPTVVGVELRDVSPQGLRGLATGAWLAAVDGNSGRVTLMPASHGGLAR